MTDRPDDSVPGGGPLPGDDPLTSGQPLPEFEPLTGETPLPVGKPPVEKTPLEAPPKKPKDPKKTPRTIIIVLAVVLLVLVAVMVWLALTSDDEEEPITPITAEPTPTVTVTVAPPTVAACSTEQVAVALGVGSAGSVPIVISNVGSVDCTLDGYPAVALVGGENMLPIGAAAVPDPLTPTSVVLLGPGASGQAVLAVAEIDDPETCEETPALGIAVDLPGPAGPLVISTSVYAACANDEVELLTIGAVQAR